MEEGGGGYCVGKETNDMPCRENHARYYFAGMSCAWGEGKLSFFTVHPSHEATCSFRTAFP